MNINFSPIQLTTLQGHQSHLNIAKVHTERPDLYEFHHSVDMVLTGSADSRTGVSAFWDVPKVGATCDLLCELDLKIQDTDGESNLQLRAHRDQEGQAFLQIANPGVQETSGLQIRLPDVPEVEDFLREGYFASATDVGTVNFRQYRQTETGAINGCLIINHQWIHFSSPGDCLEHPRATFDGSENPLELTKQARDVVQALLADKNLDWL